MIFYLAVAVKFHIILRHILHFSFIQPVFACRIKSLLIAEFEPHNCRSVIQPHFTVIINSQPVIFFKTSLVQNIKIQIFCRTFRNSQFFRCFICLLIFFRKRTKIIIDCSFMFFQLSCIALRKIRLIPISGIYIIIRLANFYNIPGMSFCTFLCAAIYINAGNPKPFQKILNSTCISCTDC